MVSFIKIETVIYAGATRLAKMEVKVDTLWAFQMRRGVAEALQTQLATMDSPMIFHEKAIKALEPLRDSLVEFAASRKNEPPLDLAIDIERQFGSELLMQFCIPLGARSGHVLIGGLTRGNRKNVEVSQNDNTIKLVDGKP